MPRRKEDIEFDKKIKEVVERDIVRGRIHLDLPDGQEPIEAAIESVIMTGNQHFDRATKTRAANASSSVPDDWAYDMIQGALPGRQTEYVYTITRFKRLPPSGG